MNEHFSDVLVFGSIFSLQLVWLVRQITIWIAVSNLKNEIREFIRRH